MAKYRDDDLLLHHETESLHGKQLTETTSYVGFCVDLVGVSPDPYVFHAHAHHIGTPTARRALMQGASHTVLLPPTSDAEAKT